MSKHGNDLRYHAFAMPLLSPRNDLRRTAAVWLLLAACSQAPAAATTEVRNTITAANAAFARAVNTNDAALLRDHFDGEILQSLAASIARAKERGTYADSQLISLDWGDIRIDDSVASVTTTEVWQHTHFDLTSRKCAFRIPARSLKQTFHLQRRGDRWVIVWIVDDPGNPRAQRLPC